jgi:hypothetical protein
MKKAHDFLSRWVSARNVGPFVPVAMKTRQHQVIEIGCTLMLSSDYVVYLKRQTVMRKRDAAIFAALFGPPPDLTNRSLVH